MKKLRVTPAWTLIKTRLKRRYRQLTDADLSEAEKHGDGWLQWIHRIIGGSIFELAYFIEQITEQARAFPQLLARAAKRPLAV